MDQRIVIESTADLHAAAVAMAGVADSISAALSSLADTLSRLGDPITVRRNGAETEVGEGGGTPPWGGDSYGKSFAQGSSGYVELSVGLLQGGFDLTHTLSEFASGMRRAAGDHAGAEEDTSTLFR